MDASRDADLSNLKRIFDDPMQPRWKRAQAYRGFQRIQEQVKDSKLNGLRHQLIHAVRAEDNDVIWKIEKQIQEYSRSKGWN